jgi:outer membrane protein OmpA-like peptidoglycan-associated protein
MSLLNRVLTSLVFLLAASAAMASQKDPADVEGTQDHPEISRFPNFHLDSTKRNDYNESEFPVKGGAQRKAGKFWFVDYILNDGARQPSSVELMKNYENAFKKNGGSLVFRGPDGDEATYRQPLTGGGERWMLMHIENEGFRYQLTIIDVAAMEQKLEFTADQMADAIHKNGFVALNGILFDTGKATIKPESQPLVDEMVALLKKDPALKLTVVGHTDNAGDKKANLGLSKQRADSVMKALVSGGVDAKRLKSDGKGDTVPVGDNRTEDGRARNRRVELVKG